MSTPEPAWSLRLRSLPPVPAFGWLICGAAGVLFLISAWWFFHNGFRLVLNSDAAVPVLLAAESWSKGHILPVSWYYANNDLWLVSPQLLALPFVLWLGPSSTALMFGNLLGLLCLVGALSLLAHRLSGSWAIAFALALGTSAMFSAFQEGVVYVQIAYGWITAKLALLAFLALRIATCESSGSEYRPRWEISAYSLLLAAFVAENPSRALAFWCIPIAVTCLLRDPQVLAWRRAVILLAASAISAGSGALLHTLLKKHLLVVTSLDAFVVTPIGAWTQNLDTLWQGLPALIGYERIGSANHGMLDYALTLIRVGIFAAAAVALAFPCRQARATRPQHVLFQRLVCALLAVTLALFIIGNLAIAPASVRYLVPAGLLSLIAFMTRVQTSLRADPLRTALLFAFVLAFCGGGTLRAMRYTAPPGTADCSGPARACRLLATLRQEHLTRGFATYWNANVTTLASDGRATVCGLAPRLRPLIPFRWLVSTDCFDPSRYRDDYFYAFTRAEAQSLDHARFEAEAGIPTETLNTDDYEILVYRTNSAGRRLEWLHR